MDTAAPDAYQDPHQDAEQAELARRADAVRQAHGRTDPQQIHVKQFDFDWEKKYGQCRGMNDYRLNKCRASFRLRKAVNSVETVALRVGVIIVMGIMHTPMCHKFGRYRRKLHPSALFHRW